MRVRDISKKNGDSFYAQAMTAKENGTTID
jgi:hypothetical protein